MLRLRKALFFSFLWLGACDAERVDDAIPPVSFPDIFINLSLPAYVALGVDGGSLYVNGGVRGIIIYRQNASTYFAFERNCSFQPNDACATVEVHSSTLFMNDVCCGSVFNFNGEPTGGPAWRPLRQYTTYLSGTELTITDVVLLD